MPQNQRDTVTYVASETAVLESAGTNSHIGIGLFSDTPSAREQLFKPFAVRNAYAVRRAPGVQRPTPAPAIELLWLPAHLPSATPAYTPHRNNWNTT